MAVVFSVALAVVAEVVVFGVVFSTAAVLLFTAVLLDNFLSLVVDVFVETAPAFRAFVAAGFLDEGLLAIGFFSAAFRVRWVATDLTTVVLTLPLPPSVFLTATFVFSAIL
ncbi:MAG: hypothetical protein DIU57_004145 [Pseudomonadota bacterium]